MIWLGFLRGINLGRRNIKMDALKSAFADIGYPGTQTVLASGNVLIRSATIDEQAIERGLKAYFDMDIYVVLRRLDEVRNLVASEPFRDFAPDADIKRYVLFSKTDLSAGLAKIVPDPDDFAIVRADGKTCFLVGFARPNGRYGEKLDQFEKVLRDQVITMRNWNTINRMLSKAEQMEGT